MISINQYTGKSLNKSLNPKDIVEKIVEKLNFGVKKRGF
tara:strand:- start:631 stop:747 length:117 start_codon:yes stop_codon:yes gene_type:complete